jgi:hypothetical protein
MLIDSTHEPTLVGFPEFVGIGALIW